MPTYLYSVLACLLFCCYAQPANANPPIKVKGRVIRVIDGDTFELLVDRTSYRIRLNAIDAPEQGQDHYKVSKLALAGQCFDKIVTVVLIKKDRYQRWLGDIHVRGTYLNRWMVEQGHAWQYTQFSKDPALAAAQKNARQKKLGLWAQGKPVAPWQYRAAKRKPRKAA